MARLVINEWLWAYAGGDDEKQRIALHVVERLAVSEHQILVIAKSAFERKAYLCGRAQALSSRLIARLFFGTIHVNSDRCLVVEADETPLPGEYAEVKDDDEYLIRALLRDVESILVTTDNPLREIVRSAGRQCLTPEELLRIYLRD